MTALLGADALTAIDRCMLAKIDDDVVPGAAWGVVVGDELVHASGAGVTSIDGGGVPGARTLFRIASMTKSFTAATVLSLRDEGRLRLDDPVATYVPELTGLRGPTTDSPAVTVRHLLTMDSGLATDDPWADRHLDIGAEELDEVFRGGGWFAHPTGTAFEYSNLGFAMLGRVVANVTGGSCQDAITDRFLRPLGLLDTVWTPRPDQADVAVGHRRVEGEWELEDEPMGDGGIAPMGGLWSTVADMARWVSFFLDAFPPRDGTDGGPLCRASRREMQRVWRPERLRVEQLDLHGRLRAGPAGYGCGLFVIDDLTMGLAVAHSGGLPGYGSNMRWMPHRGIGVVSLANVTYAPMASTNRSCFEALHAGGFLPPARTLEPPPPLRQAASDLVELLGRWSHDRAGSLFADNVVLDDALHRRAEAAAQLVETIGQIGVREVRALSRGSADVVVQGERGAALVELSLHPGAAPMVQWYDLTVIVAPAAELLRANEALCALVRTDVTASDLDGLVDDELAEVVAADLARLAGRVGPCRPASVPGDEGRTTFRWHGHGDVDVDVAIEWHAERARVSSFGLQLPTLGDV